MRRLQYELNSSPRQSRRKWRPPDHQSLSSDFKFVYVLYQFFWKSYILPIHAMLHFSEYAIGMPKVLGLAYSSTDPNLQCKLWDQSCEKDCFICFNYDYTGTGYTVSSVADNVLVFLFSHPFPMVWLWNDSHTVYILHLVFLLDAITVAALSAIACTFAICFSCPCYEANSELCWSRAWLSSKHLWLSTWTTSSQVSLCSIRNQRERVPTRMRTVRNSSYTSHVKYIEGPL